MEEWGVFTAVFLPVSFLPASSVWFWKWLRISFNITLSLNAHKFHLIPIPQPPPREQGREWFSAAFQCLLYLLAGALNPVTRVLSRSSLVLPMTSLPQPSEVCFHSILPSSEGLLPVWAKVCDTMNLKLKNQFCYQNMLFWRWRETQLLRVLPAL